MRRDKKTILGDQVNVAGINSKQVDSARRNLAALTSGAILITLPVSETENAEFELLTIKSADIESKTTVPDSNGRNQALITEESLNDILPTIRDRGQQTPALGYFDSDGKIAVLSGSRRRKACHITTRDYLIYVTKKKLTQPQLNQMAEIGNAYRSLSLVEQGKRYEQLLADGVYTTATELAKGEKVDGGTVSIARAAFALPPELISLFPSVNEIGRPTIKELKKIVSETSEGQLSALIEEIGEYSIADIKDLASGESLVDLNKEVIKLIKEYIRTNKPNQNPKSKSVLHKLPGGGNVSISKGSKAISFSFKGLRAEQIAAIEASVNEVIKAC